ncbi:MAG: hypothetical protein LBR79_04580 [Oscillospiraceae bacterium]|jgi:hypothetical protein|nr:hypothetical protein [Oscillospiraceae bacterium]
MNKIKKILSILISSALLIANCNLMHARKIVPQNTNSTSTDAVATTTGATDAVATTTGATDAVATTTGATTTAATTTGATNAVATGAGAATDASADTKENFAPVSYREYLLMNFFDNFVFSPGFRKYFLFYSVGSLIIGGAKLIFFVAQNFQIAFGSNMLWNFVQTTWDIANAILALMFIIGG